MKKQVNRGFTLIELLVVVLIIGILAAVAVPQYQVAVMKSRFSAMMPLAKALAESNEVHYLEHGYYATELKDLDVHDSSSSQYPDGTTVSLSEDETYDYISVTRDEKNNYVVYQKYSKNFAGNIDCEALTSDEKAQKVCQSLGGEEVGENGKYTVYRLVGNSTGKFLSNRKVTSKTCSSTQCNYYFEDGERLMVTAENTVFTYSIPFEEDTCNSNGYCNGGLKKENGDFTYVRLYPIANNPNQSGFYYDEDGQLIQGNITFGTNENGEIVLGTTGDSWVSAVVTPDGVINWQSRKNVDFGSGPEFVPVVYYANGQVNYIQKNYSTTYYYHEDGTPYQQGAPDVSSLAINPANYQSLIQKYSKSQCELFPEIEECR